MKKLFISSLIALAGLVSVSCMQEHIEVVFDPDIVDGQTLGQIPGGVLSEDGAALTASYNEADFKIDVPVTYTLLATASGDSFDNAKKVNATIADGTITIDQVKLNKTLGQLGATPEAEFAADFRLDACLVNEKGAVESTKQMSNVVTAVFTVFETDKVLDVCDVPGDYQGWAPSDYPKLFNYSGDGTIYRGVVDFQCKKEDGSAANGFKITYGGNWDNDSGNWGSASQAEAAEAGSVQLVNGDASQNIICYGANRYYLFSFNKDQLVLNKLMSFDKVGVIGLNDDWDNDIVMTYNMYKGRFWADVDVPAATTFKFRLDGAWDNNWGGALDGLTGGGDNIPIDAGQYRIYFYMNDEVLTATIDASMYGQEEPTIDEPEPEPVTYEGWGIIGVGGDWEHDIAMTENGGVWTGYAKLTADDNWKLRKDAGWDENFGGTFAELGKPFEAVAGGDNIAVGQEGFYKIELNTNDNTITVSNGDVWSLIGDFNEWSGDVDMTLTDGKWVSPGTALKGGWKIRHNHDWADNFGGKFEALDTPFEAVAGGDNIDCGEGEFVVTFDPAAATISVSTAFPENIWSVIGSFEASNWNNDVKMTLQEGVYNMWISDPISFKAGDEFKVRFNRDWGINRGADCTLEYGMTADGVLDGANIKVPADGTYTVVYSETANLIFFKGWSVIGEIGGTSWDTDFVMAPMWDEKESVCLGWVSDAFAYEEGKGFKIRYQGDWAVNRGGTFTEWAKNFPVTQDGDNIAASACSYIFATYSVLDDTMYIGRADWSIIGGFNNWNGDVPMLETEPGIYDGALILNEPSEIKIRKDREWNVDRGGSFSEIGKAFDAVQGGGNIALEAGNYTIEYNSLTEKITIYK